MRIISGSLRGHKLKTFKASHIRPTTDRVKETIFNKLMMDIPEADVLDLFSGTGNLSFESYSRGANSVTSVELSKKSIHIIKENLKHLKIEAGIKVVQSDVLQFLKSYQGDGFDVILVDPPFTKKMAHDVMSVLSTSPVVKKDSVIVVESSTQERIEDQYADLVLSDRKPFGDKTVSFFTKDKS